jgi:chromosome segregation ATPase
LFPPSIIRSVSHRPVLSSIDQFFACFQEKEVKVGQQKREQIGVELYGLQQSLAKQQMLLERTHEKHVSTQASRTEAEQSLISAKQTFAAKRTESAALQTRVAKSQKELDAMLVMLRQVDEYSSKMQSEIAVTKRIAYGAEEDIRVCNCTLEKFWFDSWFLNMCFFISNRKPRPRRTLRIC